MTSQDIFGTNNTTHQNYGQMRVDQTFSAADSLFGRYTVDNAVVNTFASPTSSSVYDLSGDFSQANDRNQYITLSETHIFSPTILNTARLSFSRTHPTSGGTDRHSGPFRHRKLPHGQHRHRWRDQHQWQLRLAGNRQPDSVGQQLQNIYNFGDDVNWTRGKHSFKFGTQINRYNEVVNSPGGSVQGQIIYPISRAFLQDNPNLIEFKTLPSVSYRFTVFNTLGFYAQDDIRVTPRLTLTWVCAMNS